VGKKIIRITAHHRDARKVVSFKVDEAFAEALAYMIRTRRELVCNGEECTMEKDTFEVEGNNKAMHIDLDILSSNAQF
jgi:hypothetical protein